MTHVAPDAKPPREFPTHLLALVDHISRGVSMRWYTFWTRLLLRSQGCHVGRDVRVDGPVILRMRQRGAIRLGEHVRINSRFRSNLVGLCHPTVLECIDHGKIVFGDHSGCSGAVLSARTCITVGRYVQLGGNVRIYDHDYHALEPELRRGGAGDAPHVRTEAVTIEDDVFVGADTIICRGVHIGARAIIGAGSVVRLREVPPDSMVIGNPARVVSTKRT